MIERNFVACLLFTLCVPLVAQPRLSKAELTAHLFQQQQLVDGLWKQKEFDQAADVLYRLSTHSQIHELEEYRAPILYYLACSYSLGGRKTDALRALGEAVDAGFSNVTQILGDSVLTVIRAEPGFSSILAKLRMKGLPWDSPPLQSPFRDTLSEEERVVGLSRVWTEVKYNFAYFDNRPTLDWDSLYVSNLSDVKRTASTLEYYRLLQKMCAQLGDGHTGISVPRELFLKLYARPPLDTRLLDGRVMVSQILEDSLRMIGIVPGQELMSIDGIPVRQYAEERVAPYVNASTVQSGNVQTYEYVLLCGPLGSSVELELRGKNGDIVKRKVRRTYTRIQSVSAPVDFRLLDQRLGYVALNTFANKSVVPIFDSVFAAVRNTDALILDLRENTGGNSDIGYKVLGYLTDTPFGIVKGRARGYDPFARAMGRAQRWQENPSIDLPPNGRNFYSGRVVLLVSARTGSSAEDFCVAFRHMKRGSIVGTLTAGSTGQPLFYSLPGGGRGFVCTLRTTYPDDTEFVGIGIEPDVVVTPGVSHLLSGRDVVLDEAVRLLQKDGNH